MRRTGQPSSHKPLALAIGMALGSLTGTVGAAVPATGNTLVITNGSKNVACVVGGTPPDSCLYGVTTATFTGSWFSMDTDGNGSIVASEITAVTAAMGGEIVLGSTSTATGSHSGTINGSEVPAFDIWEFFGNTGMDYADIAITPSGTNQLTFSGWSVTWSGIPKINMGGGTQDCGTATDGICVDAFNNDIAGTYDNGTGLATVVSCTGSCGPGDSFVISYDAVVPQADPSNFGGVAYGMHVEGVVGTTSSTTTTSTTTTSSTTTTAAATTTTTAAATTTTTAGATTTTTAAATTTTTAGATTTTTAGATTTTTAGATTTTTAGATTTTTTVPATTTSSSTTSTSTTSSSSTSTTSTTTVDPGLAPVLEATQGGIVTNIIDPEGGNVTVRDILRPAQSHDWSSSDNALQPVGGEFETVDFTFDPTGLADGFYEVVSIFNPTGTLLLQVESTPPVLGSGDADGDGMTDSAEGLGDADGDGIPNYLDNANQPANKIPVEVGGGVVTTDVGQLELGDAAMVAGADGVGVTAADIFASGGAGGGVATNGNDTEVGESCVGGCFSMKITGLEPGATATLLIPLNQAIPAEAVYRKFSPSLGWHDFSTADGQSVFSSKQLENGFCPEPFGGDWSEGLNAGDNCVRLIIKDGDPANDADGEANGTIVDPGGPAQSTDETPPVITVLGDDPLTIEQTDPFNDPGATATDDRDGKVTVQTTGTVDVDTLGDYIITYSAADSAGNIAQATRTVTVDFPGSNSNNSRDFGCTVGAAPVNPASRGEWGVLAGFLALLGLSGMRKRRKG